MICYSDKFTSCKRAYNTIRMTTDKGVIDTLVIFQSHLCSATHAWPCYNRTIMLPERDSYFLPCLRSSSSTACFILARPSRLCAPRPVTIVKGPWCTGDGSRKNLEWQNIQAYCHHKGERQCMYVCVCVCVCVCLCVGERKREEEFDLDFISSSVPLSPIYFRTAAKASRTDRPCRSSTSPSRPRVWLFLSMMSSAAASLHRLQWFSII